MNNLLRPAISCNPDGIPDELKLWPHWVLWKLLPPIKEGGKPRKLLCSPTTRKAARTHDLAGKTYDDSPSDTWTDFETAQAALERYGDEFAGLGFVLTEGDPFCAGDIDNCRHDSGILMPEAAQYIEAVDTYTEVSQSGRGLHFIGKAKKCGDVCKDDRKGVELYNTARYFAITGHHVPGTPITIEDRQDAISKLEKWWFPPKAPPSPRTQNSGARSLVSGSGVARSDADLLALAFRASNGAKTAALYHGDLCGYPSESEARMALLYLLAFYTQGEGGGGLAQLERLYRQSSREQEKSDRLLPKECARAVEGTTTTYQPQNRVYIPQGLGSLRARSSAPTVRNSPPAVAAPAPQQLSVPAGYEVDQRALDATLCHFAQNDVGNAQRLVARHGDDLRYDFSSAAWLIWDGKRFRPDDTGEIVRRCMATAAAIYHEAGEIANDQGRKAHSKFAQKTESERGLSNMEKLARVLVGVSSEQMDADPFCLPVANGLLNLRTGTLSSHNRAALNTRFVDIEYDPSALCPTWEWFLDWAMMEDQQMISFLRQAVGYSLTGDVREQCLLYLYGRGRNGKTTFIEVLESLTGDYGDNVKAEAFLKDMNTGERASPSIAKLKGRRVVTVSEMEDSRRLDEALIKGLTGGDTVTARFLHKNEFSFKPTFKIWWFGNYYPSIRGIDDGIWRRMRIVEFRNQIPESLKDPALKDKLATERVGILAWAVRGCMEWYSAGKLPTPPQVKEATDNLRLQSDPVGLFISDQCETGDDLQESMHYLHSAYDAWYAGASQPKLSSIALAKILESKGFTMRKTASARMRKGLRLKTEDPQDHDALSEMTHCDALVVQNRLENPHESEIAEKSVTKRHSGEKRHPDTTSLPATLEQFGQMIADAEQNAIPPQRVKLADGCDVQNLNVWVRQQVKKFRVSVENDDQGEQETALHELQNCFPAWEAMQ